jgi:hypothetical protein
VQGFVMMVVVVAIAMAMSAAMSLYAKEAPDYGLFTPSRPALSRCED